MFGCILTRGGFRGFLIFKFFRTFEKKTTSIKIVVFMDFDLVIFDYFIVILEKNTIRSRPFIKF